MGRAFHVRIASRIVVTCSVFFCVFLVAGCRSSSIRTADFSSFEVQAGQSAPPGAHASRTDSAGPSTVLIASFVRANPPPNSGATAPDEFMLQAMGDPDRDLFDRYLGGSSVVKLIDLSAIEAPGTTFDAKGLLSRARSLGADWAYVYSADADLEPLSRTILLSMFSFFVLPYTESAAGTADAVLINSEDGRVVKRWQRIDTAWQPTHILTNGDTARQVTARCRGHLIHWLIPRMVVEAAKADSAICAAATRAKIRREGWVSE